VLYKFEPQGIEITAMTSYNQKLKSTTPTQSTVKLQFGEWLYTQFKWSEMELREKCDFNDYLADVQKKFKIQLDQYIERQMLMRMACVNPCWNNKCRGINGFSRDNIYQVNIQNSHLIPLKLDAIAKSQCDDRGFFLTWPRCHSMILSSNEEVKSVYQGGCTTDIPSITGKTPNFGSNTKVVFSDHVPFRVLADGRIAYAITHAPFGSFGYASMLAVSEVVSSDAIVDHWARVQRMIMRYGMVIPQQWDYTTIWVVFDETGIILEHE
jgi:hypothetical protein